jgi:cytochrome b561
MFNFSTVFFVTILCAAPWNYKSKDTVMKRYHPILVMIHWVMLVLIVMAWTSGQFVLEHTPNSDPGKIDALRMHMIVGLIAGALLILRLITKLRSEQPPHARTGSALFDKASVWAPWAFYVVILLIVAGGMGTRSSRV